MFGDNISNLRRLVLPRPRHKLGVFQSCLLLSGHPWFRSKWAEGGVTVPALPMTRRRRLAELAANKEWSGDLNVVGGRPAIRVPSQAPD